MERSHQDHTLEKVATIAIGFDVLISGMQHTPLLIVIGLDDTRGLPWVRGAYLDIIPVWARALHIPD